MLLAAIICGALSLAVYLTRDILVNKVADNATERDLAELLVQTLRIADHRELWQAIIWSIMARSIAWALLVLAIAFCVISRAQAL